LKILLQKIDKETLDSETKFMKTIQEIKNLNTDLYNFLVPKVKKINILVDGRICRIENSPTFSFYKPKLGTWVKEIKERKWIYPSAIGFKWTNLNELKLKINEYMVDKNVIIYIYLIKPDSKEIEEIEKVEDILKNAGIIKNVNIKQHIREFSLFMIKED